MTFYFAFGEKNEKDKAGLYIVHFPGTIKDMHSVKIFFIEKLFVTREKNKKEREYHSGSRTESSISVASFPHTL